MTFVRKRSQQSLNLKREEYYQCTVVIELIGIDIAPTPRWNTKGQKTCLNCSKSKKVGC